jgi:signal peptidase
MKVIKLIKYTFLFALLFVMICLITLSIATSSSKNKYLELFGYSFFEVKSYSMYPELSKGDLVIVKKRDSSEYKVGMIVTYLRPTDSTTTTHKIVSIDGNIVTTKGVNENTNKDCDLPFDIECIVGEVVTVWKDYSDVKDFIVHPIGIIIIVLTGFLVIEVFNYLEEKYSNDEK